MSTDDLERRVQADRSAAAAETAAAKARRLEIAASTARAVVQFAHPHLLDLIGHDFGEEVSLEDISEAAAETAAAAGFEQSIANGLSERAGESVAPPPPGPPPAGLGHPETLSQSPLYR